MKKLRKGYEMDDTSILVRQPRQTSTKLKIRELFQALKETIMKELLKIIVK